MIELFWKSHDMNKESVKCSDEPDENKKGLKKCSILFEESIRLDYYFVEKDGHTMYPDKLYGFSKNTTSGEWQLAAKFTYLKFMPNFGEEQVVNSDLPIGLGCQRLDPVNYPRPATNLSRKFELEYDVTFNYINQKQNLSALNYRNLAEELKYVNRTYSGKMYVDMDKSLNIADGIDELTNASIRSYYNTKKHMLYTVNLADDSCVAYNHSANNSNTLNWFYVQDSFVKRPNYFGAKNYSFLREHRIGDVPCLVFEKKFNAVRSLGFGFDFFSKKKSRGDVRPNQNDVVADDYVISTHYQPKDPNYWSGNTAVPKRIEIQILHYLPRTHFHIISYLTIDVKSLNLNSVFSTYDTSKCTKPGAK